MIHLDCPKCGTELEMDSAFRGSVCRCHACGALIRVPRKRRTGAQLAAPNDRPDSPLDITTDTPQHTQSTTEQRLARRRRHKQASRRALWVAIAFVLLALGAVAFMAYRTLNP